MTRRSIRPLVLLMRDARGRFLRIRATLAEMARTVRPRPRRRPAPVVAVQLALF